MLRLSLFAGLAGVHLAVLQFCYFFLLLINVTSTYITYITIVVAWMLGTMMGLWWRALRPLSAMLAGVVAYYLTSALVLAAPLATHLLPIAALGVAATGLWAGQLFVHLLPQFDRADRLFLHENNGFLIGVVGVFIGFTLLGQPFLLGAPLVSLVVQLAFLLWLRIRPPRAVCATATHATVPAMDGSPLTLLADTAWQQVKGFAVLAVVLNLLLTLGTLVHGALNGEPYWKSFAGQNTALSWFSSVQLVLVGVAAYAVFQTSGLLSATEHQPRSARRWVWLVFAIGFITLSVGERFGLGGLPGDDALTQAALVVETEWMGAGELTLLACLTVAAVFGLLLLPELRRHESARWLFLAAVSAFAATIAVHGVPVQTVDTWLMPRFWSSVFPAVAGLCGQLLFLLSFIVVLLAQIREIGGRAETALNR